MNTGSLVNSLAGDAAAPEVGMGATRLMWTDRHACTIVEVGANGKRVVVQEDTATRTDGNGMSESQSYDFAPDTTAPRRTYTLRKNGRYVLQGETAKNGERLAIGYRAHYYDYSF